MDLIHLIENWFNLRNWKWYGWNQTSYNTLLFSFAVDEYVKMEGNWDIMGSEESSQSHSTLLKGKRHCTLANDCFGVITGDTSIGDTSIISINFPIRLIEGGSWYIYKKKGLSGGFINQEYLLVIDICNKIILWLTIIYLFQQ